MQEQKEQYGSKNNTGNDTAPCVIDRGLDKFT